VVTISLACAHHAAVRSGAGEQHAASGSELTVSHVPLGTCEDKALLARFFTEELGAHLAAARSMGVEELGLEAACDLELLLFLGTIAASETSAGRFERSNALGSRLKTTRRELCMYQTTRSLWANRPETRCGGGGRRGR
jgi:hypothetical protein